MNRRPTVPLADWRIAAHLADSTNAQNQPGTPAYGCQCNECEAWRNAWSQTLPSQLAHELQRLRIDLNHPVDLYAYERTPAGVACRVIFHCVGRVLEGPSCWREMPDGQAMLTYQWLRGGSNFVGLAVYPQRQSTRPAPNNQPPSGSDLIQIDMRLLVPSKNTLHQRIEQPKLGASS